MYTDLKKYCDNNDIRMVNFIEEIIENALIPFDSAGYPNLKSHYLASEKERDICIGELFYHIAKHLEKQEDPLICVTIAESCVDMASDAFARKDEILNINQIEE
jgi:hypothetical protein